ncbi:hypothetical protein [Egicoccus halophilus]|uniref:Uncharacterized protein n=1 Tax=Egicoccus halophilus TaxID=1670830 RepID=A0A8J3EXV8_9ACTN|nr:hypothetical protein [Egicoccus halophilus]GGI06584.1 hypothetical protein GCM10011354_19820 [Egicoccus halophilus]
MKTSKLLRSSAAALAAVFLVAGPVSAAEDPATTETAEEAPVGDHGAGTSDRYQIAETPRQQVGLLLYGALGVGAYLAFTNARRQYKGERSQATGEFRWR